MSEYLKIVSEYPNICFSHSSQNNMDHSFFALECANIIPSNYDENQVRGYKKYYTWNGKVFEDFLKKGINAVKIPNFPFFDNYFYLEKSLNFEERIGDVSLVCRYRDKQGCDYDIAHERVEVFEQIEGLEKHTYGKIPYCGDNYKGVIGKQTTETYPSSLEKLVVLNKYKFNLCFENAYHEFWSWDYITEKITDCFRAQTIPIYKGCFNIEERIPKDLYIDYREFKNGKELSEHLKSIDEKTFNEMTASALQWEKETKLGDIKELKEVYLDND